MPSHSAKEVVKAKELLVERLQTREHTNHVYIDEIAEAMKAGVPFPPITVWTDGIGKWLTDGIHRLDGAIKASADILVDWRQGGLAEAVEHACGANHDHGLRRTNDDKRRAVKLAVEQFPGRSSRAIAKICRVDDKTVESVRAELSKPPGAEIRTSVSGKDTQSGRRVGRDGKSHPAVKPKPPKSEQSNGKSEEIEEPPAREWGDGDSLEDVQADLRELAARCKSLSLFARKILRCDGNDIKRPYCKMYSLTTLSHPLLHVSRCVTNDLPVGGTPAKPILYHQEKARSLA